MSCAAVACRSQWLLPLRSAAGSPVPSPSVPEEVCKLSAVTSWRQQWHSPPAVSPCPSRLHSAQLSLGARWAPGPAPCTRRRKPACPCAQDPHSLRRRQKRAPCTNQNAVTSLSRNDGQSGGGGGAEGKLAVGSGQLHRGGPVGARFGRISTSSLDTCGCGSRLSAGLSRPRLGWVVLRKSLRCCRALKVLLLFGAPPH